MAFSELDDEHPELEAASTATLSPLEAGINAIPGIGNVKRAMEGSAVRKFVPSAAAMAAGSAPGDAMIAAGVATGQPLVSALGVVTSAAGAGAGNVVGGTLSDMADDPKKSEQVFNLFFNPTNPSVGQQLVQNYQKDPEGTLQTLKQEGAKAGVRFTTGFASQIMFLGLRSLVPTMPGASATAANFIPGAQEGIESRGMQSDPSMTTRSRIASVLKGMMNKTQVGMEFNAKNEVALNDYTKNLTTDMAGGLRENIPPSELAKKIVAPKQELGEPLQREIEKTLYDKLDVLANAQNTDIGKTTLGTGVSENVQGLHVPTDPLKKVAQSLSFVDQAGPAGRIIQKTMDQGRFISFQDMHAVRSDLETLVRSGKEGMVGPAKMMVQAADQAMETAAKSAGDDVYSAWRNADAFVKSGKQTFNNDITAKWMLNEGSAPEKLGERLVDNGTVTQVKQLKAVAARVESLVNDPANAAELQTVVANNPEVQKMIDSGEYTQEAVMNKYRKGVLQNLFSRYQQPAPDSLVGSKTNYLGMLGEFDPEFNPEGAEVYKELWGKGQLEDLKGTMTAGYRAIQKAPTAYDRAMLWAGRILSGAAGSVAGSVVGHPGVGLMAGEGAYLLGEGKVASYMLTDPKASKIFTEGLNLLPRVENPEMVKRGVDLIIKAARTVADHYIVPGENQ